MMFMTDTMFKYELEDSNKTATLISPIKTLTTKHVKIPKMIGEYTITAIAPCAFEGNCKMETIEIPDSVFLVDDSAFSKCGNLEKVYFYGTRHNHKIIDINKFAFADCFKLKIFEFATATKKVCVGSNAFAGCSLLYKLNPLFLKLGANAFFRCVNLDNIVFAHSAKWMPSTFAGCLKLNNITFFGDIDDSVSDTCIEWLKDKNIECVDNSKIVNLAYEGVNVKILPF